MTTTIITTKKNTEGKTTKHSKVKGLGLHGKKFIAFLKIVLCSLY